MVIAKHHRSVLMAAVATVALGWCASGLAQTTAAPASGGQSAAPTAPAPQVPPPTTLNGSTRGIRVGGAPAQAPAHHAMHRASAHHEFVEHLQTALNSAGASLTVDGMWGPKTSAALKAYQQQHNLKATGRPDKATREALGMH